MHCPQLAAFPFHCCVNTAGKKAVILPSLLWNVTIVKLLSSPPSSPPNPPEPPLWPPGRHATAHRKSSDPGGMVSQFEMRWCCDMGWCHNKKKLFLIPRWYGDTRPANSFSFLSLEKRTVHGDQLFWKNILIEEIHTFLSPQSFPSNSVWAPGAREAGGGWRLKKKSFHF